MLQDMLLMTAMFFVRLVLPFLVLFVIGYLIERWLSYPEEHRMTARHAEPTPPEGGIPTGQAVPAWSLLPCASRVRHAYAVLDRPALPCWLAVELAEGRLLEQCLGCQWYRPRIKERAVVGNRLKEG